MIIYGVKAKELAKESLVDKCPNCGALNSIDMYVFEKYAHVFWIPFFPVGKSGVSNCSQCKQVLNQKEMPASLKTAYENLKTTVKTPVWMFVGLVVVAVLVAIAFITDKQKENRNVQLISAPKTGDIYHIKEADKQYTLYKIAEIKGDSVFVNVNKYATNLASGLNDLKSKGDSVYSPETLGFSTKTLENMLRTGEILDVERGK